MRVDSDVRAVAGLHVGDLEAQPVDAEDLAVQPGLGLLALVDRGRPPSLPFSSDTRTVPSVMLPSQFFTQLQPARVDVAPDLAALVREQLGLGPARPFDGGITVNCGCPLPPRRAAAS